MKKAFIAGAICPSCGKEDKIFVLSDESSKLMLCAHCDFKKDMNELENDAEPQNESASASESTEIQVVKWKQ